MNIIETINQSIKKYSDKIALSINGQTTTYSKLQQQINYVKDILLKQGIKPGDKVAILAKNIPDFISFLFGIWECGGVLILIDASLPDKRIEYMITTTEPKLVLSHCDNLLNQLVIKINKIKINLDYMSHCTQNNAIIKYPMAYICFTSGSTGIPKPILVSHKSLNHFISWQKNQFNINTTDSCLQITKLSFDVIYRSILTSLISGARLVFPEENISSHDFNIFNLIKKENITYIHSVPSVFKLFLSELNHNYALPNLRYIFFAGEKLEISLVNLVRNRLMSNNLQIINLYGPTETTLAKLFYTVPATISSNSKILPVGKPLPETECFLVDNNKIITNSNVTGEIVIVTDYKSEGYIGDQHIFKKVANTNLYGFFTGDIGYKNENDDICVLGRFDDQIKINGVRIEPAEIDYIICQLPQIKDAVTIFSNNQLICYIILNQNITLDELYSFLSKHLLPEMIPHRFLLVDKFVYSSNGKLDKRNLSKLCTKDLANFQVETHNLILTQKLIEIWQDVFKVESITLNDNFYKLGGNSLLANLLAIKIQKHLNIEISTKDIFNYSSLINLANYLSTLSESKNIKYIKYDMIKNHLIAEQAALANYQLLNKKSSEYNIGYFFEFSHKPDNFIDNLNKFINNITLLKCSVASTYSHHNFISNNTIDIEEIFTESDPLMLANKIYSQPIDITQRLFRVCVLYFNNKVYLLIIFHHIISDGESSLLFFRALEKSFSQKKVRISNKITLQKDKTTNDKALNFWKQYLFNYYKPIAFYDLNHINTSYYRGNTIVKVFHSTTLIRIYELSKQQHITDFALLLSIFIALLSKFNQNNNVVAGIPVNNRHHYGVNNSMGCYVKTLPLIIKIDSEQIISKFIEQVQDLVLNLIENSSDCDLYTLIQNLGMSNKINRFNITDFFFSYDNYYLDKIDLNNVVGNRIELDNHTTKYPLSFMLNKSSSQELICKIEYDTTKFSKQIIETFAESYFNIIEKIDKYYDLKVSDITYPENYLSILIGKQVVWKNNDIIAAFLENVIKFPDNIAVIDFEQKVTYSQLWNCSKQISSHLQKFTPEDTIAVLLPRGYKLIASLLAIWYNKLIYLPIDLNLPQKRILDILDDSNPKLVIAQQNTYDYNLLVLDNKFPDLNKYYKVDKNYNPINLAKPAYLLYTSGTTGKPKGVLQTHKTLVNLCNFQHSQFNKPNNIIGQFSSQGFDVSLQSISYALYHGATLVIISDKDKLIPNKLWNIIADNNINLITLPPSILELLAEYYHPELKISLNYVITSGQALKINQPIQNLFKSINATLINQYGPTETHVITQYELPQNIRHWAATPSIGSVITNCGAIVLDRHGNVVPHGIVGELFLFGDNVAIGYNNNINLTDTKFINYCLNNKTIRLYKTGDLVTVYDNLIYFNGRVDDQIKLNGFRIEPKEIETVLAKHKDIRYALVRLREFNGNSVLVCYYTTYTSNPIAESELKQIIVQNLPMYMQVNLYKHLLEFPLTINGKVNEKELPKFEITNKPLDNENYTEIQARLNHILVKNLKSRIKINRKDNLFSFGFNSLTLARILVEINKFFMLDISFNELLNHHTLFDLSLLVENKLCEKADKAIATNTAIIPNHNSYFPTPQQHRILSDIDHGQNPIANNLCFVLELKGNIKYKNLLHAINKTLENHDVFKTILIKNKNGNYVFKLENHIFNPTQIEDLLAKNIDKQIELAQNVSLFGLNQTLHQTRLFKLSAAHAIFILSIHHIIFDGSSAQYIFDEIKQRYNKNYQASIIPGYLEAAAYFHSMDLSKNKEYLNKCLKNIDNLLYFNPNNVLQAPAIYNNIKSSKLFTIDNTLNNKIKITAKNLNVTLFTILIYAYMVTIQGLKISNKNLLIGTTVNGRNNQFEHSIGLFAQRIVIAVSKLNQLNDRSTKIKFLQEIVYNGLSNQVLSIYNYKNYKNLITHKNLATPQFNIVFQNYKKNNQEFNDINSKFINSRNTLASLDIVDITLVIEEYTNYLDVEIVYNQTVFSNHFIDTFAQSYISHIQAIIS